VKTAVSYKNLVLFVHKTTRSPTPVECIL